MQATLFSADFETSYVIQEKLDWLKIIEMCNICSIWRLQYFLVTPKMYACFSLKDENNSCHSLYSDGTHYLLSQQKMSKFNTFSIKYSIPTSIFSR